MKGHSGLHNPVHLLRAHSNYPVVNPPLSSKDPKGIFNYSAGSGEAVVENPPGLGEVFPKVGPEHIPPCNEITTQGHLTTVTPFCKTI